MSKTYFKTTGSSALDYRYRYHSPELRLVEYKERAGSSRSTQERCKQDDISEPVAEPVSALYDFWGRDLFDNRRSRVIGSVLLGVGFSLLCAASYFI